ncbi:MAG: aldehyde dehydrogenase family protein [Pseudomonadota bacterium]
MNRAPGKQVRSVEAVKQEYKLTLPKVVTGFVDGESLPAHGDFQLTAICPATETPLYELDESSAADVDRAVRAARAAFDGTAWPTLPHSQRKGVLRRICDVIEKHQEELAVIQALEVGLPLSGIHAMHMPRTIENFDFFSEVAGTLAGESFTQTGNYLSVVTHEPAGVAALLTPWNAPLVLVSMKLAAALSLGNTVVLKPSEYCPYSLRRFVEVLHEADLPPGVVNLVNGRGPVTGDALVRHPGVDVVGFVGGTETGKVIMASAAQSLKKVGMELGGKSANIVTDSANLETAIDGSLLAILAGNGSQCLAGSRILLQRGIANEFVEKFTGRLANIRVGDPFDPQTEVGAMAFAAHYQRVLSYVDVAREEGGEVLVGGKPAPGFEAGYFMEPTAVMASSNQTRVCQEEIFGPFASLLTFDTLDEAVAMANESDFGLVSYLWSDDLPTVMRASRQIKAGTVWVNTPLTRDLRAPFGGYKQSGVGRDGLRASVELLTEEKTMMIPNEPLSLPKLGQGD